MEKQIKNMFMLIIALFICLGTAFSLNTGLFTSLKTETFAQQTVKNAINEQEQPAISVNTKETIVVSTTIYKDNNESSKSYTPSAGVFANDNSLLGGNWLNLRINTNSDAIAVECKGNNNFVIDSTKGDRKSSLGAIVVEANFNYNSITNINNQKWDLNYDGAKNILGFSNLGDVGMGAFIIETSYDNANWNQAKSALKTVNVTDVMNPSNYNASNKNFKVAYQASGDDINKGINIRIKFAYELMQTTYSYFDDASKVWVKDSFEEPISAVNEKYLTTTKTYYNILETATFYIANNSGVVGFHNLSNNIENMKDNLLQNMVNQCYVANASKEDSIGSEFEEKYQSFLNGDDVEITRDEKIAYYNLFQSENNTMSNNKLTLLAEQYFQSETLEDGDLTLTGFSLDKLGNNNYSVTYKLNDVYKGEMKNGQLFLETGKYDIFVSTPWQADKSHYTIYVNPRASSATLSDYFDTNFISSASKRVYDIEAKTPVFVKDSIYYQIKNSENNVPLSGKIVKYDNNGTDVETDDVTTQKYTFLYDQPLTEQKGVVILLNNSANNTGKLELEAGFYVATFYTNTDFTNGITGDYYTFTYIFEVIDEKDVTGPIVNQSILNSFANISRFQSQYFGVQQTNVNGNKITFAFQSYETAYNFAYDLESRKVTYQFNAYWYNGIAYNAKSVGQAIHNNVLTMVEKKYFDASDSSSYLTISDQLMKDFFKEDGETELGIDILNESYIQQDVVVFLTDAEIDEYKTDVPFLNDGKFATLNPQGLVTEGKSNMQFISVADYESKTIKVVNLATQQQFSLQYNQNIENQLIAQAAPSGKYKIVESNLYGDGSINTSIYYAIYIAQENTSVATITYLNDGIVNTTTLNNQNENSVVSANSLVLEKITNEFDPYAIVKINYNGNTVVKAIYELSNYKLDQEGNYQIEIVDRLGNEFHFVVNIISAVDAIILTYEDGTTQSTFVSVQTILKNGLTKNNYDFMGWTFDGLEDEYTTSYVFTNSADIRLTSVWHHSVVDIIWQDGDYQETTQAKPEDTIDFDTEKFSKDGFDLVGFMWNYNDKNTLFTYRISSIPNVKTIYLTAIYKKTESIAEINGITLINGNEIVTNITPGTAFPVASEEEGMTFVGWMKLEALNGVIYNDIVPNLEGNVVLNAVYVKTITEPIENQNTLLAGIAGIIASIGKFISTGINQNTAFLLSVLLVMLLAFIIIKLKAKKPSTLLTMNIAAKPSTSCKQVCNESEVVRIKQERNKVSFAECFSKLISLVKLKYLTFALCILLAVVLGSQNAMINFAKANAMELQKELYSQSTSLEKDDLFENLEDAVVKVKASNLSISTQAKPETQYEDAEQICEQSQTIEVPEFSMTDAEAFLYSTVMIDLTTLGYSVFVASIMFDNTIIYGIAYTKGDEVYEKENEANVVYIGAGFAAFLNQEPITQYAIEQGITITPINNERADAEVEIKYTLSFEETYKDEQTNSIYFEHYVVYGQYVHYAIYDYSFHAEFTTISNWDEAESLYDQTAGAVYSYDDGYIIYDAKWNNGETAFDKLLASGFNSNATSDQTNFFFQSFTEIQDTNFLNIDTGTYVFYSQINLNEIYLQLQKEEMLGITAEQWRDVEQYFNEGVYYFLVEKQETNEQGELLYLELDDGEYVKEFDGSYKRTTVNTGIRAVYTDIEYSLIPQPKPQPNYWLIGAGVLLFVGGMVLSCVTLGAGSPAGTGLAVTGGTIIAAGATVSLTSIVVAGLSVVTALVVAGVAMDVGFQLIQSGIQGKTWEEGIADINWKRALMSGMFNAVEGVFGSVFQGLNVGWKVVKFAGLVVLEGFEHYALAITSGDTQSEAWEQFGWGVAFAIVFNSLDLINSIIQANASKNARGSSTSDITDDVKNVKNKLDDQLDELPEELQKRISNARSAVTQAAKRQELKLLEAQLDFYDEFEVLPNGVKKFGSAQNFTYDQACEFVRKGAMPDTFGHHIKNVQSSIDDIMKAYKANDLNLIDEIIKNEIKNKNNIIIGSFAEHLAWHGGNFANSTSNVFIEGQRIVSIDRQAIINLLKGIK